GPVRPARPATIKTREYQLRVAASALVQCGHNPQRLRSIADMLSFERYQEILRVLMGRHGGETSPQVGQIAAFLKDVARHWLKVDELELQRFKKIASRLAVGRRGLTTKNRERLRPFDEPETVAAFLGLPQRIRGVLNADKRSPRRKAILAQMAAAIALLQAAPIRLSNLTDLDVVKNLIGRGRRLTCASCGAGMTRTGTRRRDRSYSYYSCAGCHQKGKSVCRGRHVPMAKLDALVI